MDALAAYIFILSLFFGIGMWLGLCLVWNKLDEIEKEIKKLNKKEKK